MYESSVMSLFERNKGCHIGIIIKIGYYNCFITSTVIWPPTPRRRRPLSPTGSRLLCQTEASSRSDLQGSVPLKSSSGQIWLARSTRDSTNVWSTPFRSRTWIWGRCFSKILFYPVSDPICNLPSPQTVNCRSYINEKKTELIYFKKNRPWTVNLCFLNWFFKALNSFMTTYVYLKYYLKNYTIC